MWTHQLLVKKKACLVPKKTQVCHPPQKLPSGRENSQNTSKNLLKNLCLYQTKPLPNAPKTDYPQPPRAPTPFPLLQKSPLPYPHMLYLCTAPTSPTCFPQCYNSIFNFLFSPKPPSFTAGFFATVNWYSTPPPPPARGTLKKGKNEFYTLTQTQPRICPQDPENHTCTNKIPLCTKKTPWLPIFACYTYFLPL